MKHSTRIILVDIHSIFSEGLEKILSDTGNFEMVSRFSNGNECLHFLDHSVIEVVLLDVALPDMKGNELCKIIKFKHPKTVVLVLSHCHERRTIMDMLSNGANGYLLKNTSLEELIKCIDAALQGEIVFSKDVKEIISFPQLATSEESVHLTNREKEVLALIALGKTTMQMADQLHISKHTVESHRKNLLQKFKSRNMAELIKKATVKGVL
ncbi:response regulator [Chryseobacterium gallinarum]|uniref:Response regulator transcription factor n=1 Tax=Chryseobacterium gallinarum TaxID=1324352 RepID=A0ABX6KS96_CHRGL|nr:response regulator transcription factor [Chryseobacterium gallinarum]QIY90668.1 response regulator transcription factor [Chryseobacterium gallinarum]